MCARRAPALCVLTALLLVGMAGCVNLDVVDPNASDAARALSTPGDVEALIGGAFSRWTNVGSYYGPTMGLSVAAAEHSSPWACGGMEVMGRIPRVPTNNAPGAGCNSPTNFPWPEAYAANAAVREALKQIDDGLVDLDRLGPNGDLRARAFGKFVQGLAHATIAVLYDSGFVYDETMDPSTVTLRGYRDVMNAALGYLQDAATLAGSGSFTVPAAWMSQDVSSATLAQLAHAMAARFRAAVARTPAERQAVDWTQVVADVNASIAADWLITQDCHTGEFCNLGGNDALLYRLSPGWQMQDNWVAGMADTSGAYQAWVDTPLADKLPFIVHTPDTRWPQGPDEQTQLANPGEYYSMNSSSTRIWSRPDRGTWRWSYYYQTYEPFFTFALDGAGSIPFVKTEEMAALKAEAAYYGGDMQAVADFVNATRTLHGLLPTDAAGTNPNCVPRLPNGSCGDLWEMFKWEKRLETQFAGPLRVGWYFDGRGWGDLLEGTPLQFPVPYREMQLRQEPAYDFGGVGGAYGAPAGTYDYCKTGGCSW